MKSQLKINEGGGKNEKKRYSKLKDDQAFSQIQVAKHLRAPNDLRTLIGLNLLR